MIKGTIRQLYILVSLVVLFSFSTQAAVEQLIKSKTGSAITVASLPLTSGSTPLISVKDQYMPFSSSTVFAVKSAKNILTLRYEESKRRYDADPWNLTIDYEIRYYSSDGTVMHTDNSSLTIDYATTATYKDKDVKVYDGGYKAEVFVTAISYQEGTGSPTSTIPSYRDLDIYLDIEQQTERFYYMDVSTAKTVVDEGTPAQEMLPISWKFLQGAESYDVEWLFIDIGDNGFTTNFDYDFRNATRINTTNQFYNIPLAFPKGILLYRVRGVGIDPDDPDFEDRTESLWTINATSPTGNTSSISSATANDYRYDYSGLNTDMNWQYTSTYAEEGKRKEVISYFDGSLRNRQTATVLSSDNNVVIAEPRYDYEGRSAVQLLPTPVENVNGLQYYSNFNPNFNKADFDLDANYLSPGAVDSTADHTGIFYSSNNTNQDGVNAYIAGAKGYPYSRTMYKQDGTNRITRQGGVGGYLGIGSGHETKYYYGTPLQVELDRLFGNEVGNFQHYKKNMVQDPNGQVSVSYLDQEGRTIATALAGSEASNQRAIDLRPSAVTLSSDLLLGNNVPSDDEVTSLNTIVVSTPGTYTFDYNLNGDCYDGSGGSCTFSCEDCKYDLYIELQETESGSHPAITLTTQTPALTYSGNPITIQNYNDYSYHFTASLGVGTYSIVKRLSVNQDNITSLYNAAYDEYLSCLTVPQVEPEACATCQSVCEQTYISGYDESSNPLYVNDAGESVTETVGLGLIANCEAICNNPITAPSLDPCTLKRMLLKNDMSPGGQYFDNLTSLNLFDSGPSHINDWLNANISTTSPFHTWFSATFAYSGPDLNSWDDVRANWQDVFGDTLLQFHPEYCAYHYFCEKDFCNSNTENNMSASNAFDLALTTDATGDYCNPTHITSSTAHANATDLATYNSQLGYSPSTPTWDPYIMPSTGCGQPEAPVSFPGCSSPYNTADRKTMINTLLEHYVEVDTCSGTPTYMSIWYVLDDPDNISSLTSGGTITLSGSGTLCIPFHVVKLFRSIHGAGSDPGLLGGSSPLTTKYEYFKKVYEGIKQLVLYQGWRTECSTPKLPLAEGTSVPVNMGFTSAGFRIRYPANIAYETFLDNVCPPNYTNATPSDLLDAFGDAISPATNPEVATACHSNCESYAAGWRSSVSTQCSALTSTQLDEIVGYMVQVCEANCDATHMYGADGDPVVSGTGIAGPGSTTFYDFDDIFSYYNTTYSLGCTISVDHPVTPVPFSQITCTCEAIHQFIDSMDIASPTNTEIAAAINNLYGTMVSATDVQNWLDECDSSTPSFPDFASNNLPADLMCQECTCVALNTFIGNMSISSPTNTEIASAVNTAYGTSVTATDVAAWLSECQNASPSLTQFATDHMPDEILCNDHQYPDPVDPCELQYQQAVADANYTNTLNLSVAATAAANAYIAHYKDKCKSSLYIVAEEGSPLETFTVSYDLNEYNYTLYYYDQAGNLVKTVPPDGVNPLTSSSTPYDLADVLNYRSGSSSTFVSPDHRMVTHYKYNSLQQLIRQSTPDGGLSKFYYDPLGRLVVSQNAKQAAASPDPAYSYTMYDALGRIYQVGEIVPTDAMTDDISRGKNSSISLSSWINGGSRTQMTNTVYDGAVSSTVSNYFGTDGQENLRNRVASTAYNAGPLTGDPSADDFSSYERATHYSYDIHGNVKTLIQEEPSLHDVNTWLNTDLKYIDYDYDLVSGKVNKVSYQNRLDDNGNPQPDRFYHRYFYDADNRITETETSHDDVIWEKDAKYAYYPQGPLARLEIGDKQVQATDYAYTIQGWIKGVNSSTLVGNRDIGKDAEAQLPVTYAKNNDANFARDAMGYGIRYFGSDYYSINTSIATTDRFFVTWATGSSPFLSLYNGNIPIVTNRFMETDESYTSVQGMLYKYDQLNRLRETDAYTDVNVVTNNVASSPTSSGAYSEDFHYDLNGNITSVDRNGDNTGSGLLPMDNLEYHYWNSGHTASYQYDASMPVPTDATNQLAYVDESQTDVSRYSGDIDPQANTDNYQYDQIGNLVKDKSEEIDQIDWTVYGKIKSIQRSSGSTKDELEFAYDASGNRVLKVDKPRSTGSLDDEPAWLYTYYVRDAQGNIMATYTRRYTVHGSDWYDSYKLSEQNIYGSSRIGVYNNQNEDIVIPVSVVSGSINGTTHLLDISSRTQPSYTAACTSNCIYEYHRTLGNKQYELANHLGNVMAVISDRKLQFDDVQYTASAGTGGYVWNAGYNNYIYTAGASTHVLVSGSDNLVDYYKPDVLSSQDYYSFGATMPGRSYVSSTDFRYGFNSQEKVDEVSGTGNHNTAQFWEYDTRLGRRWNLDPKPTIGISDYAAFNNSPIWLNDILGNTPGEYESTYNEKKKSYDNKKVSDKGDDKGVNTFVYSGGALNGTSLTYDGKTHTATWGTEKLFGQMRGGTPSSWPKDAKSAMKAVADQNPAPTPTPFNVNKFVSQTNTFMMAATPLMGMMSEASFESEEASTLNTEVNAVNSEVNEEINVFRVFGGDARAQGQSWTPVNPTSVSNFRNAAGLPSGGASGFNNTGEFMIQGRVNSNDIFLKRLALPLDGNAGGLPEFLIKPENVEIIDFSVLKPY